MSDPYLMKASLREMERLETLLARDPNFVMWKALYGVVTAYRASEKPSRGESVTMPTPTTHIAPVKPSIRALIEASKEKPKSTAKLIQDAGINYLRKIGRRAMSKELTQAVIDAGIEINGTDKVAVVAANMSSLKGIVDNVRGEGYGLVNASSDEPEFFAAGSGERTH